MPHKRAKRTTREQLRSERGSDLAPVKQSLSTESIPKSVSRILNAAQIRQDFKKRKLEDIGEERNSGKRRKVADGSSSQSKKVKVKIQPGESLQHFNKRVEDDMRPLVKSAMQSSLSVVRNARKAETEAKAKEKELPKSMKPKSSKSKRSPSPSSPQSTTKILHIDRPKEFKTTSSSAPRRLNDIAQAPPEFKQLPRGAVKKPSEGADTAGGVISMAQKLMMEQEREKAILRYRQLKASRRQEGDREEGRVTQ